MGLSPITDGEFRRTSWNYDFLERLEGVESYAGERKIKFNAQGPQPRAVLLRVVGKLGGYAPHPMIEHFKFLKAHTKQTPKVTIPSPSSLHFRYGRDAVPESIYPAMEDFYRDLGRSYAKVVRAFADAGCRYLQLDEVNLAYLCDPSLRELIMARGEDPATLPAIYAGMINAAISDIPPDMTLTMHLCRGNFRSSFVASGGYEPVAETLFNAINVHGYFMEYDNDRAGGFEPLRFVPKGKRVVLRLVTTKSGDLESRDDIKRRIDEAGEAYRARSTLPVAAMRVRFDRGGQRSVRGRAMGEAAHDRRDCRGSMGIKMQRARPPFRADHVGSLLRPQALKVARERHAKGEITADALRAVEDHEIEDIIRKQEAVGLQAISDGEFRRSWVASRFPLGTRRRRASCHGFRDRLCGGYDAQRRRARHRQAWLLGHPMLEHFKFLKAHTQRTPKMTIPAPSAIYGRPLRTPIDKSIYPTLDKFFDDLGQAYKKACARSPTPVAAIAA